MIPSLNLISKFYDHPKFLEALLEEAKKRIPADRLGQADEIADAAIYLDLLAQAAGFDLEAIRDAKFEKTNRKFGYKEVEL